MNNDRRKRIEAVCSILEDARAELEALAEEEQEAHDNLPESIQSGEKGEAMDEAVSKLEDAASAVEDITMSLGEFAE